jgi:competence protein ComFC
MLSRIYDSLLTLAYPQECKICKNGVEKSTNGVACDSCWNKTRIFTGNETLCFKCGQFLNDKKSDFQTFCRRCEDHSYDQANSAGIYEFALAASILNLKSEPFVAKRLRELLVARFQNCDFPNPDLIIPVPLSTKRMFERGFNQAEVLSDLLSEASGIEVDKRLLVRQIHTSMHRAGMDRKARELTVKNAFAVKRPKLIEGKRMLLVDDVFTSGSTVSSCAKALKKKGASEVSVLTIARAS